jgi:tetratricopeptide (TPR) repeat protein
MLTTNIPSVPPVENNVAFTLDDFLHLYRSVASQSYQQSSHHHSTLTLVRDKLFRYASSLVTDDASLINFTAIHRKMLVDQMTPLLQNNILALDSNKIAVISQDILSNGKILSAIMTTDDKDSLVNDLLIINDECQAMQPVVNSIPAQLKTGVSKAEQNTIVYGASYFSSLPAITLCNKGLEKLQHQEWQNAVEYFQQAIAAEYQIAEECHLAPNISNIALYNRNMAYAFHMAAFSLQQSQQYADAIETYNKALAIIQAIPANLHNTQDTDVSICCHRDVAICENLLANKLFETNQILEAIEHYKLAISMVDKIPGTFHNENDAISHTIYKRNLAFALNKKGQQYFEEHNFTESIKYHESARIIIAEIQPEWRQEGDSAAECIYQVNKEIAQINKDKAAISNNRNTLFKKSRSAPEMTDREHHSKKRKMRH